MATVPEEEMNIYVDIILDSLPLSDVKLMEIKEAQDDAPRLSTDKELLHGRLARQISPLVNDALKPYLSVRGELTIVYGILLKSSRIVVPSAMKLQVLDKIHEGHRGYSQVQRTCEDVCLVAWSQPRSSRHG